MSSGSSRLRTLALSSLVVLLGVAALAIGLLWYMPARVLMHQANPSSQAAMVSGRVVHGAAQVPQGYRVEWRFNGWRSLLALSPTFDVTATGPGADLTGRLSALPDRYALRDAGGTLSWAVVPLLAPDLGITCDLTASVDGLLISQNGRTRRALGGLRTSPGTCARDKGEIAGIPVPALVARLTTTRNGIEAVLAAQNTSDIALATATLTNQDRLILRLHAAGARLVPGMPASSEYKIELPLSAPRQ